MSHSGSERNSTPIFMKLLRFIFGICLLCFVTKQLGHFILISQDKVSITCESASDDCEEEEEEENSKKDKLEEVLKAEHHTGDVSLLTVLKTQRFIASTNIHYSDFFHSYVSPPPDFI